MTVKPILAALTALSLLGAGAARGAETPEATASSPESEKIVREMIEAHGGMDRWANAPTVSFTDEIVPASSRESRRMHVTVEQGPRRVFIDVPGSGASLAWDGEKAWSVNWKSPIPPRFLAQLDYYFLCLPWLTQDDGVILGPPGTARLWDDPTEYVTVRMTFAAGVGDTPRDYYLLYIDPRSRLLRACEYVVTYAALLPPGVEHTPPHTLVVDDYTEVDGLRVPTGYTTYTANHREYLHCTVSDWSFTKPFDASRMVMPEGAVVDTSSPTR
jgi:hypothetical protein